MKSTQNPLFRMFDFLFLYEISFSMCCHTYLMRAECDRRAFVRRLQCLRDALRRVGAFGRQSAIGEFGLVLGD